ncbi:uncharacterized protein LOC105219640 isoform X2 [Zeugodacus cucurbitae]|uniref:uncharacterized protein LOC105219640 isoform X2 n=1 Tax=Zeugodacus cucurbitae TaxID=28588 RepID=UPI0023D926ED|nr:uncharacterized protein LOC105219640 isoform X2 [Zeugodacus cucurbitae]
MSEKKVRSGKVTKQQKQKLLDLLKNHRNVGTGQFGGPNSGKAANAVWATLTAELNACGRACKTVEQWKKCWADWKSGVKKQQAAIMRFQNATGNRPASEGPAPLDGMDLQVLDFFPTALVDGDGVTKESGFQEMNADEELQKSLDDVLDTPQKTANAALPSPTPNTVPSPTPDRMRQTATFFSAFEQVKTTLAEQERKRQEEFDQLLSVAKDIRASVQSMAASLKQLCEK